eukprot:scpid14197/ scgid22737/ 
MLHCGNGVPQCHSWLSNGAASPFACATRDNPMFPLLIFQSLSSQAPYDSPWLLLDEVWSCPEAWRGLLLVEQQEQLVTGVLPDVSVYLRQSSSTVNCIILLWRLVW